MAQLYPHRDTRPPAMVLANLGAGYLNELPKNELTLKAGLKDLYDKAKTLTVSVELKTLFDDSSRKLSNDVNITIEQFVRMLLELFRIEDSDLASGKQGRNVTTHLKNVFTMAGDENLFRIINNSELKMTIWKLVMTDINLVIYQNKHCNALDVQNYLGDNFCRFWNDTFKHTLTSTQLYSIITKLTSIQPGMPPREITETLLKLFNNKLAALGEVSYNRLWKMNDSTPTDLTPFSSPPRPVGARPAGGAGAGAANNKYLKYKAKYLALKNAMSQ